jgi:tryptophan 2,3-dioxygenase
MPVNYLSYLKVDSLLSLQEPQSDPAEHDEMLFIIIHQVYELWFRLLLHELDKVKQDFSNDRLHGAIATLTRVRNVLKTLVGQLDVLETMTPLSFSAFRDRLESASGFQSLQFRELEFVLGYKRPEMMKHVEPGGPGAERVERRLREPSLMDHFYEFLVRRGVAVPDGIRHPQPPRSTIPDEGVQQGLLRLYREAPDVAILLERMTDVDEGLQEWRYRHVKLVERTIGNKHGTGGSLGVEFLKRSLFQPVFPDLWAIRHEM